MSVNITKVYLLNVPFENDYKHTVYFASEGDQREYFNNLPSKSFEDFSYQRKDGVIRVPIPFDSALKYNYVMYQNPNNSNKWYYAFITNHEYKGDDQTNITIETDVMQTYMFNHEVLASYVEREHVDDDTVGLHTLPENLECGEFTCIDVNSMGDLQVFDIVIGVTEAELVDGAIRRGGNYHGIYSGITYILFSRNKVSAINYFLVDLEKDGKIDTVKCIFVVPQFLTYVGGDHINTLIGESEMPIVKNFYVSPETGYTPNNKKLLTYPYRYLLVSNNNGGSAIYQYEHFVKNAGGQLGFKVSGCITPGCSIRLEPMNYKGVDVNSEEGLNLGKYPICNWTSDEYTNWLTQNSVNIALNMASGVGQIIAGGAIAIGSAGLGTAVGGSGIVSGASTIASQLTQIHQMSFTPPQSHGNINCGDVITSGRNNSFFFYQMSIKDEYAKIIDDYFSMFGYKCGRVKVPNKAHRVYWWYTKTVNVNIKYGDVPLNDRKKIADCYDNGITFWRSFAEFKVYDNENNLIYTLQ